MDILEDLKKEAEKVALPEDVKADTRAFLLDYISKDDSSNTASDLWYDEGYMEEQPKEKTRVLRKILFFFDKLEDKVRTKLSHNPILYTFIGGFAIVLFWRGVWMTADMFPFLTGPISIIISVVILLVSGLFVSFFVGDVIILSGLKGEKKLIEKTEHEVKGEAQTLSEIQHELKEIEATLKKITNEETK